MQAVSFKLVEAVGEDAPIAVAPCVFGHLLLA